MRVFNLGIHIVTAVVMAGNGILLLFAGLMLAVASGLFSGNAIGLIMLAAALLVLYGAIYTFKVGFADSTLLQTDQALYRAQELRLALIAFAFTAAATLVLLTFNSFSISDVFEYGFGWVLYILGAVGALNLVSCVLTLTATGQ